MTNAAANLFAQLLTEAIYQIRHRESKSVQAVQDELGYALGKRGGASIEYWRKGNLPAKMADLESLTRAVVQRGGFSSNWAAKFLTSANYPYPSLFLGQLFSDETAVSPLPHTEAQPVSPTNLPAPPTPFLGRKRELAAILKRLDDPDCQILTLVGPGGIGKTRLAIRAAEKRMPIFPNGTFFVSLDTVDSPDLIISSIINVVQPNFVIEGEPKAQFLSFLRDKRLLLIIDNFEHLISGAPLIAELVKNAPFVQVMLTSRERLNLQGEWVYEIKGMQYPALPSRSSGLETAVADPDLEKYSAVQLFIQSAQRVRSDFDVNGTDVTDIVRICQSVAGFPLAIELAATWVRVLTCAEIAQEIMRNYEILATNWRDIPARHQSLQSVFDYSWRLLSDDERDVLGRLAVFQGVFSRIAAVAVTGVSLAMLGALVDKSFLQVVKVMQGETAVTCYEMHELIRFYAFEALNRDASLQIGDERISTAILEARDRHARYYAARLEIYQPRQFWNRSDDVPAELGLEIENVRAARNWILQKEKSKQHAAINGVNSH